MSARNFASHFGRKACSDLGEYDFVKAKHAENLQDLLDRPYEDILAEEIIQLLHLRRPLRPTMEVDTSAAAKKPRVSSEEDVPMEGSSLEEVSAGQPGSSSKPSKVEGSSMEEGSAQGSQR